MNRRWSTLAKSTEPSPSPLGREREKTSRADGSPKLFGSWADAPPLWVLGVSSRRLLQFLEPSRRLHLPSHFLIFIAICLLAGSGCAPERFGSKIEFPLGIYSVRNTNDFPLMKQIGFNLLAGDLSQLDAAQRSGLKVLAPPGSSAGANFNPAAVQRAVRKYDRHPALWGWYLVDEPDLNGVPPDQVRRAHRAAKLAGARKPTVVVLYQGGQALHYGRIADVTMIDRYPIPWLPLANFPQHVELAKLAVGRDAPLMAIVQTHDWSYYPDLLPGQKNLRPPTYQEIRCMTYAALAEGATGIFYYAYDDGRWKVREHPETWEALQKVVAEVNERIALFAAKPVWRVFDEAYGDPTIQFNEALRASINVAFLRVNKSSGKIAAGEYMLAVNNTPKTQTYRFRLWAGLASSPLPSPPSDGGEGVIQDLETAFLGTVPVAFEDRSLPVIDQWAQDAFGPYEVHIYGPLPGLPQPCLGN